MGGVDGEQGAGDEPEQGGQQHAGQHAALVTAQAGGAGGIEEGERGEDEAHQHQHAGPVHQPRGAGGQGQDIDHPRQGHQHAHGDDGAHDGGEGHGQADRLEAEDAAALLLVVGEVEGGDHALGAGGGGPERHGGAEAEAPAQGFARAADEIGHLAADQGVGIGRQQAFQQFHLLGDAVGVEGEAVEGDQHGERGEQRQRGVEGAAGGDEAGAVALDSPEGAHHGGPPAVPLHCRFVRRKSFVVQRVHPGGQPPHPQHRQACEASVKAGEKITCAGGEGVLFAPSRSNARASGPPCSTKPLFRPPGREGGRTP